MSIKNSVARTRDTDTDAIADSRPLPASVESIGNDDRSRREFERQFKTALARHGGAAKGRVFLFSLERVRESLGESWGRHADKVHATARMIFERHLAAQEFFIRYDDVHYVVAFGDLDEARATIKLALVAQDIGERLLGKEQADGLIDIRTAELTADGEVAFSKVASVDSLVENADDADAPVPESPAVPMSGTRRARSANLSDVAFIFRPLWFARKRTITNYLCIPVLAKADGGYLSDYDVLGKRADRRQIAALDLLTIARVGQELGRLHVENLRSLLCLPVHFETLATQTGRTEYVEACRANLWEHENRVVFELVGLAKGIPQSRVQALVQTVRPFARSVMARLDLSHRSFTAYRGAGVSAVGIDIFSETRPEKTLMREMEAFVEAATRQRLRTYVHGLRSQSLTTAAICAGFDYVDGYAITSVEEGLRDIRHYDIRAPYDRKAKAVSVPPESGRL